MPTETAPQGKELQAVGLLSSDARRLNMHFTFKDSPQHVSVNPVTMILGAIVDLLAAAVPFQSVIRLAKSQWNQWAFMFGPQTRKSLTP